MARFFKKTLDDENLNIKSKNVKIHDSVIKILQVIEAVTEKISNQ